MDHADKLPVMLNLVPGSIADDDSDASSRSLAEVHDRLRAWILTGALAPGKVMSQVALAKRLNVSRTPLREALRLLEREGLVLAEPNRRIRIAPTTISDAEEVYSMIVTLGAMAARATIPHLPRRTFAELEGLMAQMTYCFNQGYAEELLEAHHAFHRHFISGAGPRLLGELEQLFDHLERHRRMLGSLGWSEQEAEAHRKLVVSASHGDVTGCVNLLTAHFVEGFDFLKRRLQPAYRADLLAAACGAIGWDGTGRTLAEPEPVPAVAAPRRARSVRS